MSYIKGYKVNRDRNQEVYNAIINDLNRLIAEMEQVEAKLNGNAKLRFRDKIDTVKKIKDSIVREARSSVVPRDLHDYNEYFKICFIDQVRLGIMGDRVDNVPITTAFNRFYHNQINATSVYDVKLSQAVAVLSDKASQSMTNLESYKNNYDDIVADANEAKAHHDMQALNLCKMQWKSAQKDLQIATANYEMLANFKNSFNTILHYASSVMTLAGPKEQKIIRKILDSLDVAALTSAKGAEEIKPVVDKMDFIMSFIKENRVKLDSIIEGFGKGVSDPMIDEDAVSFTQEEDDEFERALEAGKAKEDATKTDYSTYVVPGVDSDPFNVDTTEVGITGIDPLG